MDDGVISFEDELLKQKAANRHARYEAAADAAHQSKIDKAISLLEEYGYTVINPQKT